MHKKDLYFGFIEMLAQWEGLVNSTDLAQQFSLSSAQAKRTLTEYNNAFPENLVYSESERKFCVSANFSAAASASFNYFIWLANQVLTADAHATTANIAVVNADNRHISPAIMRPLMQAIRNNHRIEIDYVSLTNPISKGRVIQPHALVKTAQRWHVRAFDEYRNTFRDYVISRFRGIPELSGPATHRQSDDKAWTTIVTLEFAPDSRLTNDQKRIVEADYGMQHGKLTLSCRAALIQYLLDEMQVKTKFHDANPAAQQLVLINYATVKHWLFDS